MNVIRLYNIKPKEKLGQVFLIDERVLKREVEYAELSSKDVVLEIGSGFGSLTKFLVEKAKKVYAIERDSTLIEVLKSYVIAKNLEIIQRDALRITFPEFNKCVSNLPYVISSPITFKLLKHDFEKAILTYQKEFAERLIAKPG
ncbi:MAG: 16S rRNA methyltransferase, partial [Candidatus Hydrothermarchaeota archaeon]